MLWCSSQRVRGYLSSSKLFLALDYKVVHFLPLKSVMNTFYTSTYCIVRRLCFIFRKMRRILQLSWEQKLESGCTYRSVHKAIIIVWIGMNERAFRLINDKQTYDRIIQSSFTQHAYIALVLFTYGSEFDCGFLPTRRYELHAVFRDLHNIVELRRYSNCKRGKTQFA